MLGKQHFIPSPPLSLLRLRDSAEDRGAGAWPGSRVLSPSSGEAPVPGAIGAACPTHLQAATFRTRETSPRVCSMATLRGDLALGGPSWPSGWHEGHSTSAL